jgi:hypothetical protein|nr:MAG TPA: hypothetical protein [Caudoviricetes sp.]
MMINLKTTDAEQKVDTAVKMFIGFILDSKDELNAANIDFVGMFGLTPYDVSTSFIIAKGNKRFNYTYTISIREIEFINPELLPSLMRSKSRLAIEKIKEQLIKNVK